MRRNHPVIRHSDHGKIAWQVAAFNLEQRFYDGYVASSASLAKMGRRDALTAGFFSGLSKGMVIILMGVIFWFAVWLAAEGKITFVQAFAPMFVFMGAIIPMMHAGSLADAKASTAAAARLFALFDTKPRIDPAASEGQKPTGVRGEIELREVVFAYPPAPDHRVCDGYSLTIRAGQTVALCGASGSGKSTIIALIERFYDPQAGAVLLDGVDIKELNVRWLRQQLGLVGQEPVLFMRTVAENIGFGKAGATRAEIEAAAAAANAHGFITESLAHGYDTPVGQGGSKLSGGQKQRVAIARALVRAPSVLLLDEATSALDNESERVVQAALDEIMATQQRTTVVIAHRLSTIRGADTIAVVHEGKVVEQGTHDELLGLGGMYTNLAIGS